MSRKSLNLFPVDPHVALPPADVLTDRLRAIGLIGERYRDPFDVRYAVGPRFEELITFHSSHRVIELLRDEAGNMIQAPPRDSREFCLTELHYAPDRRPNVIVACITEDARCPCGFTPPESLEVIGAWWDADRAGTWTCPACGRSMLPWELDWNHAAGFATDYIEIVGINPSEATPSAALCAELGELFGGRIAYAYTWI